MAVRHNGDLIVIWPNRSLGNEFLLGGICKFLFTNNGKVET